jgi:hypothetical protein
MREVLRSTCIWLLVLLLTGTSPFGMGVGMHKDQLLDLLFPHVHLHDGQTVPMTVSADGSETDRAAGSLQYTTGPAIAPGTFGVFGGIGTDAPALPAGASGLALALESAWSGGPQVALSRRGVTTPPPDPPPTLSA